LRAQGARADLPHGGDIGSGGGSKRDHGGHT
jgi:hypothetical protein